MIVIIAIILAKPKSIEAQYVFERQIGTTSSNGSADGQFDQANGIATDSKGDLYVADRNNERIQKFTPNGSFVRKWGSSGSGNGQFSSNNGAVDIAVDGNDNIYVVDRANHRVQKFDSTGTFLLSFGSNGTADGQFNQPTGIGINSGDTIYIADRLNERVQAFDVSGNFLFKFGGTAGSGDGQFASNNGAVDLDFDANGNIFVVDRGNHRVQKFSRTGIFIGKFGSSGSGSSNFSNPNGIAISPSGELLIGDRNNERVSIWADANNVFTNSSTFGSLGSGNGEFSSNNGPVALTFDGKGDLWVIDRGQHRIHKFDGPALATPLTSSITSQTNNICNGDALGSLTVTASDGTTPYTYNWSNTATTATISTLGAGTYTVTVTDAGGTTATSSATITEPTALNTTISSQTNVACFGESTGSLTASVTGGTSPYTYNWNSGETSATITGKAAGTYTVSVLDNNGCGEGPPP